MKWIGGLCSLLLCMLLGGCQENEETDLSGKTGLLVTLTDEIIKHIHVKLLLSWKIR